MIEYLTLMVLSFLASVGIYTVAFDWPVRFASALRTINKE